jgi:tetratricopeptide (TPR) repeat protein
MNTVPRFSLLLVVLALLPAPLFLPPTATARQADARGLKIGQPQQPPADGRYHALVIGNDDYQNVPHLHTAAADAREVARVLREYYGFQAKLLLNATRDEILSAITAYRRELGSDDSLLIYYAGHGVNDKEIDKAYWLPVDASLDNNSRWISADDITSNIKGIPARHVLVISDSCYSGTLTRGLNLAQPPPAEREQYLRKMIAGHSRTLMASGGDEPVADGGGSGHSVFAAALLRGLQQMDKLRFTAGELFSNYIIEAVAGRADQTPIYDPLRNSGHDAGDFVFVKAGAGGEAAEATTKTESAATIKTESAAVNPAAIELSFWETIKFSTNREDFKAYLDKYPDGQFAALARNKLNVLQPAAKPSEPASPPLSGADYLAKQDWKRAAESYQKAVLADPGNVEANYGLGVAYMNLKRTTEALASFSNVVALKPNPRVHDALVDTGRIHYDLNHYKEAADAFGRAAQLGPLPTLAEYELGKSYMQTGGDAQALVSFKRTSSDPQFAEDSLLSVGLIYVRQGDMKQALAPLEGAARINPRNASAQMFLGHAYLSAGRDEEALAALSAAASVDPNQFLTQFGLGYVRLRLNQNDEALAAFMAAQRLQPQSPDVLVGLGNAYTRLNRFREATDAFDQAVRLKPDMPDALIGMCILNYSQGNYAAMLSTAEQAARVAPKEANSHTILAAAYAITGRMQEGTTEAREAARLAPDYYLPHQVLGFILSREDKAQEALAEAREAVRMKPNSADALNLLGYVLNQLNQNQEALAASQRALAALRLPDDEGWSYYNIATAYVGLKRQPDALDAYRRSLEAYRKVGRTLDPDELYLMGTSYLRLDQDEQAVAALRQAIKIRPNFAQAHYDLGVAYFASNDRRGATEEYNSLKRLDPQRAAKLLSVINGR